MRCTMEGRFVPATAFVQLTHISAQPQGATLVSTTLVHVAAQDLDWTLLVGYLAPARKPVVIVIKS